MRFSLYHVVSLLCVSVVAVVLSPAKTLAAEAAPNVYPPEVVKTFMKGCQFKQPKAFCSCTMKSIQTKYTFAEFKKVDNEIRETRKVPSELQKILSSCNKTWSSQVLNTGGSGLLYYWQHRCEFALETIHFGTGWYSAVYHPNQHCGLAAACRFH